MTEANPYSTLLENVWPPPDENTLARYQHLQELHNQMMSRDRSVRGIDASNNNTIDSNTDHAGSQQNRSVSSGEVSRHRIHNRDFSQLIRRRPRSVQRNYTDRSIRSAPEPIERSAPEITSDVDRPRLSELKFDSLLADFEASFPDNAAILARASRGSFDAGVSAQNRTPRPTLTRSRSDASRFLHHRRSQDFSSRISASGTNGDLSGGSNLNLAPGIVRESRTDSSNRNLASGPLHELELAFSNATASVLGTDTSSSRILGRPNATTNYQRFVMSNGSPTVSISTVGHRSRDNIATIQEQCDASDTTPSPSPSVELTPHLSLSSVLEPRKAVRQTSSNLQQDKTMKGHAVEFKIEFDENDTVPVLGSGEKRVIYIDKKGITHYLKSDHPFLIALSKNIITKVSEHSRNSTEECQQMVSSRRVEGQSEGSASSSPGSFREDSVRSNITTERSSAANSASSASVKQQTDGLSARKFCNELQKEKDMNSEIMENVDFLINRLGVIDIDPNALSLEELKEIQRALSEELSDEEFPLENQFEAGQNVFPSEDATLD